jgi:branched-chain amino acid aminotransferase
LPDTALTFAYRDDAIVPYDQLTIHAESMAMRYALSAFEGVRAYLQADGVTVRFFALAEHVERLTETLALLELPRIDPAEIEHAATMLLQSNKPSFDCYLRVAVNASARGTLKEAVKLSTYASLHRMGRKRWLDTGEALSVAIGPRRKPTDEMMPQRAKVIANYAGPRIAAVQAIARGFDDVLLLSADGLLSEAPTANVVLLIRNRVVTPRLCDGVLPGITLRHVLRICEHLGYTVESRAITVEDAYSATEAFLCGTGLELAPIGRFDDRVLPTTRNLLPAVTRAYFAEARGAQEQAA